MKMRQALHSVPNILLMGDAVPTATTYSLRAIQAYCEAHDLELPHVWIVSHAAHADTAKMTWIPTPPPTQGNKDFQYLAVLKHAIARIQAANGGLIEVHPLPMFVMQDALVRLPIARYADPQETCASCKNDGLKGLTLRALKRAHLPYFEFDLGSPFVVNARQFNAMVFNMALPYALETYYNNVHGVAPSGFIDSLRLIAEQRFWSVDPGYITEALSGTAMTAFTRNGWNRWVSEWAAARWPKPSHYETEFDGGDPA